jgi:hypothetical protein
MPVLFVGSEPDDVSRSHLFDWTAVALYASEARGNDERLSERMRVPGGASSGFECDVSSGNERRIRSGEKWVDANGSGEPVRGAYRR